MKIIAELGNSHEGSLGLAKCMIKAAAECGATTCKIQTHIFQAESLPDAPNPPYFDSESRKDYFERTSFNKDQYGELISYAESLNVEFISSPFSVEALKFLLDLGMKTVKIPSGEVSNMLLINAVAAEPVNVIISSGMSTEIELDRAIQVLKAGHINDLTVLQCTSEYPCPPEHVGLDRIMHFKNRYSCEVGFSDHTLSESIPAIAVYAGATVIEKHFTLSKLAYGSDAPNSLEPEEFKRMVRYISEAEVLLNSDYDKNEGNHYIDYMKTVFEKSLVYSTDLQEGHVLCYDDFAAKKPGDGLPTCKYSNFIGGVLKRAVDKDKKVELGDIYEC